MLAISVNIRLVASDIDREAFFSFFYIILRKNYHWPKEKLNICVLHLNYIIT